jgi:hypothetical protein
MIVGGTSFIDTPEGRWVGLNDSLEKLEFGCGTIGSREGATRGSLQKLVVGWTDGVPIPCSGKSSSPCVSLGDGLEWKDKVSSLALGGVCGTLKYCPIGSVEGSRVSCPLKWSDVGRVVLLNVPENGVCQVGVCEGVSQRIGVILGTIPNGRKDGISISVECEFGEGKAKENDDGLLASPNFTGTCKGIGGVTGSLVLRVGL